MKFFAAAINLLVVLACPAVHARSGSDSGSGDTPPPPTLPPPPRAPLSQFLGRFRTVLDILRSGNANTLAQSSTLLLWQ